MTLDTWIGLAIIPALIVTGLLVWVLLAYASWAWDKLHVACLQRIDLEPNLAEFGDDEDSRPEYLDSANRLRDALLESPKLWSLEGLGFVVVIARDSKASRR